MTGWSLRRATPHDLDAIMALENAIFTSDAWSPAAMRAELAGEHGFYLVAVEQDAPAQDAPGQDAAEQDAPGQDAVIGYAGLLAPAASADADVQTIAVAPEHRKNGIGSALLRALLDEAARRDAKQIFLDVRADNPVAQELYRTFGFEPIGVRRGYYQPDGVDAIVMQAPLTTSRTDDER